MKGSVGTAKELRRNLANEVELRYSLIEENRIVSTTTLLDPRFKYIYFKEEADKELSKAEIKFFFVDKNISISNAVTIRGDKQHQ